MKNSAAKRNNDLHKNKNARQMQAARLLYENTGFGSRAERKCAGSKPEGGVSQDTNFSFSIYATGVILS
ncbi:MAG: hypothetical protein ACREOI_36840 [bacterium]